MSGSLRYETVESGRVILERLYLNNREEPFFTCTIKAPLPRLDTVEDGTLQIDLKRLYNRPHAHQAQDGERHYVTVARFTGDVWEFGVEVIIHAREADTVGATIAMSPEAVVIFNLIQER
jgi:hypothetical protein